CVPADVLCSLIFTVPSYAATRIKSPAKSPLTRASKLNTDLSISGVCFVDSICVFGTLSTHTVCQIPETGVYQIPCGSLICLPRGCGPSLVGSHTLNAISWLLPRLRKLEILNEKGLKPPSCRSTCCPLTYRSHCQSTAPKCRMTLSLCTFLFNEIVVWYHKAWSFVMRFPTPERADSIANGTNIFPSHLSGMVLADLSVMV